MAKIRYRRIRDAAVRERRVTALGAIADLQLVVTLPAGNYAPRELRRAFAAAIRESITCAALDGRIENFVAEELLRTIPDPERA